MEVVMSYVDKKTGKVKYTREERIEQWIEKKEEERQEHYDKARKEVEKEMERMIMIPGIRPNSHITDMFFSIPEDNDMEYYGIRDDFGIEDIPKEVWNIEEPIDKDHDYREFKEHHKLTHSVNWSLIPKEHRKLTKTHLEMEDLKESYRKIAHTDWYKKNAKLLKKLYHYVGTNGEDPESGKKVHTEVRFNEEVNDDEGNVTTNETQGADIGIAYEEKTHESFARLRFWENMVWMIAHCPDRAYDKAISRMHDDPNEDIIHEEEVMWVDHVTGGVRNNGLMRFAQYQMMTTKKFIKNNPMFYVPKPNKEDDKFECISMTVVPSEKYEKYVTLDFWVDGKHVKLFKGKTATNWLNPYKLDHDTLNEAIDWARKELTKK